MKRKLSIWTLIKTLIFVATSSILTFIIIKGFNNYESFMDTVIRAELFVIFGSVLFVIDEFICILGLKYAFTLLTIMYSSKLLKINFVEVSTRNLFLKSFEEFKKDFKVDFADFYTAEVRMNEFDIIYLKLSDRNGTVKDYKTISAVDFLKYFKI